MVARSPRQYFRNIYDTLRTIAIGMRITLKYCFAQPITVQYPDMPPVIQPRFRGFHYYEIEKCITCDACAKACPVDCIYIEKSAARKIVKDTGIAAGGAVERYAIDYAKCMFCGLCIEPCPTDCIHMGDNHDFSAYTRKDMIVEFTELAKEGKQTPEPLWAKKETLPTWVRERRAFWEERARPVREHMVKALSPSEVPKPAKKTPAKPADDKAAPDRAPGGKTPAESDAADAPAANEATE